MKITAVIPAHNEAIIIKDTINKANKALASLLADYDWEIVVSENGSSDNTAEEAFLASAGLARVKVVSSPKAGKGGAIRRAWEGSKSDVCIFFDADLSADLGVIKDCLRELASGADIVAPSRFHPQSDVERSFLRKIISSSYALILRSFLRAPAMDMPCGIKAVSGRIIRELLTEVKDDGFFFDSELILRAGKRGYKIVEVPIIWKDVKISGRKSHVPLLRTSLSYVAALARLRKEL